MDFMSLTVDNDLRTFRWSRLCGMLQSRGATCVHSWTWALRGGQHMRGFARASFPRYLLIEVLPTAALNMLARFRCRYVYTVCALFQLVCLSPHASTLLPPAYPSRMPPRLLLVVIFVFA